MPRAFHEGVFKPMQAPTCPVPGCGTACRSLGALKDHLRAAHEKRGFCDVCLEHKKVRRLSLVWSMIRCGMGWNG